MYAKAKVCQLKLCDAIEQNGAKRVHDGYDDDAIQRQCITHKWHWARYQVAASNRREQLGRYLMRAYCCGRRWWTYKCTQLCWAFEYVYIWVISQCDGWEMCFVLTRTNFLRNKLAPRLLHKFLLFNFKCRRFERFSLTSLLLYFRLDSWEKVPTVWLKKN